MVTSMQFQFVEFGLHCMTLNQLCLDCNNKEMCVHLCSLYIL